LQEAFPYKRKKRQRMWLSVLLVDKVNDMFK